ncbi:MAG: hypothetical protein GX046_07760 [Tissierellia bacterium]|nr:hypothetical protein [Tissierellia bacterium]
MGDNVQMLYRWRRLYTPGDERTENFEAQDENGALRQRIAELDEDNYILYPLGHRWKKNLTPSPGGPKH